MVWKLQGGKVHVEVITCAQWKNKDRFWWGRTKTENFGTFQANSFRHVLLVSGQGTVSLSVWVCVYSGASHTNKCAAEREQRTLDEDLLLEHAPISGSGPDTLLVSMDS